MRRTQVDPTQPEPDFKIQTLKKLIPYLAANKQRVALALICLVAAKVASVGLPFVLKYVVDGLDQPELTLATIPLALLLAYGAVRFANVIFGELRDTLFGRVTEQAMHSLGLTVFRHLHSLDLSFHLSRNTGGLARDIERGISGISFLMRFMVFNIVPTLLEISMVCLLLAVNYSVSYVIVMLLSIVAYIAWSVVATDWRTRYVRAANLADSTSNTRAVDSLMNYETVKYFGNEAYEDKQYDQDLEQWEQARRKNRLTLFALNGGQSLIISISITAMLILAARDVASGAMTLGDFVLVNAFMIQLFMPLNFLGFVYREMKGSMANIERLFGLLDQQPNVSDPEQPEALKPTRGEIRFEAVEFGYQPDRTIIRSLDFEINPGERVAVVGRSGAGKSTLTRLLFRFYDPSKGRVLLNGQDLRSLRLADLRAQFAVVPQDTVLFNQSLFENIRYGRTDATDEAVWQAIEMADLKSFVDQLPEREQTKVGERGLKLSGGEKQRVAIARAILKGAPILLFDEATSSLDSHAERAVMSAIRSVSQGHTSLIIAHRLSTVVDCDRILVLDQGHIVEQGTHQQLLAQNGHYAALWHTQQEQPEEA